MTTNSIQRQTGLASSGGARPVSRVAIIGTGSVGAMTSYALLLSGTAPEIVLINRNRRLAVRG